MPVRYIFLAILANYFCRNVIGESYAINEVCKPPRGNICIDLPQCKYFADLMARTPIPRPLYVIREIIAYQCGRNYDNSPKVCCTLPPQQSIKTVTKTKKVKEKDLDLLPRNCGAIQLTTRIFHGTETTLMEFPWMALLVYQTDNKLNFDCAGTLINERYVLTAAHCVLRYPLVGVRIGEHDIRTIKDCDPFTGVCSPPVQDFIVEKFIAHPEYDRITHVNDIALIRLATSANLTYENVKPICLPPGEQLKENFYGEQAVVAGWGVTEKGYANPQLLKTQIPIISTDTCREIYQKSLITDKQLCAGGYLGRDSCAGDSGGPLMIVTADADGESKFVQHGIVSFGPKHCGTKGKPGIYTKVDSYMEWILDNMEPWDDDSRR